MHVFYNLKSLILCQKIELKIYEKKINKEELDFYPLPLKDHSYDSEKMSKGAIF